MKQLHHIAPAMHREHVDAGPQIGWVYVHPTARTEDGVVIESGTFEPTQINARVWLMGEVRVGHDAVIFEDAEIATRANVCAHAVIGRGAKVGIAALVMPFRRVGDGAVIGAGAVVTKNVPAGEVWAGNPARRLEAGRNPIPFSERPPLCAPELAAELARCNEIEDEWERICEHAAIGRDEFAEIHARYAA